MDRVGSGSISDKQLDELFWVARDRPIYELLLPYNGNKLSEKPTTTHSLLSSTKPIRMNNQED